jgi:hypothetical protein
VEVVVDQHALLVRHPFAYPGDERGETFDGRRAFLPLPPDRREKPLHDVALQKTGEADAMVTDRTGLRGTGAVPRGALDDRILELRTLHCALEPRREPGLEPREIGQAPVSRELDTVDLPDQSAPAAHHPGNPVLREVVPELAQRGEFDPPVGEHGVPLHFQREVQVLRRDDLRLSPQTGSRHAGGLETRGHPIISAPLHHELATIPEEDFQSVVAVLVGVEDVHLRDGSDRGDQSVEESFKKRDRESMISCAELICMGPLLLELDRLPDSILASRSVPYPDSAREWRCTRREGTDRGSAGRRSARDRGAADGDRMTRPPSASRQKPCRGADFAVSVPRSSGT